MTMSTINLLIGIVSIFTALGVALMALAYVVEGLRARGGLRRWDLLVAIILGGVTWGCIETVGQDFARASDAQLLAEPANAGALAGMAIITLIAIAILTSAVLYWRRVLRSRGTTAGPDGSRPANETRRAA